MSVVFIVNVPQELYTEPFVFELEHVIQSTLKVASSNNKSLWYCTIPLIRIGSKVSNWFIEWKLFGKNAIDFVGSELRQAFRMKSAFDTISYSGSGIDTSMTIEKSIDTIVNSANVPTSDMSAFHQNLMLKKIGHETHLHVVYLSDKPVSQISSSLFPSLSFNSYNLSHLIHPKSHLSTLTNDCWNKFRPEVFPLSLSSSSNPICIRLVPDLAVRPLFMPKDTLLIKKNPPSMLDVPTRSDDVMNSTKKMTAISNSHKCKFNIKGVNVLGSISKSAWFVAPVITRRAIAAASSCLSPTVTLMSEQNAEAEAATTSFPVLNYTEECIDGTQITESDGNLQALCSALAINGQSLLVEVTLEANGVRGVVLGKVTTHVETAEATLVLDIIDPSW